MAKIDSAFEYYVANYSGNNVSRYDSHKKSDLRKVYNRIIQTNKESPLYKITNADAAKRFAIDIKESSKSLLNVVASLSDVYGSFQDSFQKKVAYSSDEDKVSVKYVGDGSEENSTEVFDIQVSQLASPQVNTGQYLKDTALSFIPGAYSFDLNTLNSSYEFQFSVNKNESNLDVLKRLSGLVNNSSLGISAEILSDGQGSSALQLTSKQTGLSSQEQYLFSITPASTAGSIAAMDTLRINKVTNPASNSSFTLNGVSHSSLSNNFTINNAFELSLNGTHEDGGSTTIGFKANLDAISDNIQTLTDAYNNMLLLAQEYNNSDASDGNKFRNDISSIVSVRKDQLEDIGLMVGRDWRIRIDKDILAEAITPDKAENTFDTLNKLKNKLREKSESIIVDPMNYVNKVVVAYKNPGHNFNTPYITSIYSGLMLDNYA